MLILSRKIGEQIVMPDQDVILTVVAVRGNRVRIGITAPKSVHVLRAELQDTADTSAGCFAESGPQRN